jgi:hypothetical protein
VTDAACARPLCPHCQRPLCRFLLPESGGWPHPLQWACFNDECGYYTRGWDWMMDHYGVKSSYRYRLDPVTGQESPLPVWSPRALRDHIVEPGEEGADGHLGEAGKGTGSEGAS